jgi:hypothetical protein
MLEYYLLLFVRFPLSNSPPPLLLEAADGSFVIRRNVFIECMGMEVGLNTFNPK